MVKGQKYLEENAGLMGIREDSTNPASVDLHVDWGIKRVVGYKQSVEAQMFGDIITLEPGQVYLVPTQERLCIPEDCIGIPYLKSSWIRSGLQAASGIFDPGFVGNGTVALTASIRTEIRVGQPFVHMVYYEVAGAGLYDGQYQNSEGAVADRGAK